MAETTETNSVGRTNDCLTRERDWITGAWEMLGDAGLDGVRVEPLARRLGVTKGKLLLALSRPPGVARCVARSLVFDLGRSDVAGY